MGYMQITYRFGCLGTIGVVLVILRAFRLIKWSWWLVTAPLWGPVAFWLIVLAVTWAVVAIRGKITKGKGR